MAAGAVRPGQPWLGKVGGPAQFRLVHGDDGCGPLVDVGGFGRPRWTATTVVWAGYFVMLAEVEVNGLLGLVLHLRIEARRGCLLFPRGVV